MCKSIEGVCVSDFEVSRARSGSGPCWELGRSAIDSLAVNVWHDRIWISLGAGSGGIRIVLSHSSWQGTCVVHKWRELRTTLPSVGVILMSPPLAPVVILTVLQRILRG